MISGGHTTFTSKMEYRNMKALSNVNSWRESELKFLADCVRKSSAFSMNESPSIVFRKSSRDSANHLIAITIRDSQAKFSKTDSMYFLETRKEKIVIANIPSINCAGDCDDVRQGENQNFPEALQSKIFKDSYNDSIIIRYELKGRFRNLNNHEELWISGRYEREGTKYLIESFLPSNKKNPACESYDSISMCVEIIKIAQKPNHDSK